VLAGQSYPIGQSAANRLNTASTRPKMPTGLPNRAETNLGRGAFCPFMKEFQIDAKGADAAAQTLYFLATDRRYAITSAISASLNLYAGILVVGPMVFLGSLSDPLR